MWPFKKSSVPRQGASYGALIESGNRILLTVSASMAGLVFLNESMMDTICVHQVNYYHPEEPFPFASMSPEHYPEWTWNVGELRFVRTRPELITDSIRKRSRLASEKCRLITDIMRVISVARYPASTGVFLQETMYLAKKAQASAFREAGYPEDNLMEYHYVVQYADFAKLSLREAADDILFKAKLDEELLAKTELLRLKYFNLVRSAIAPEEIKTISEDFIRESRLNSYV